MTIVEWAIILAALSAGLAAAFNTRGIQGFLRAWACCLLLAFGLILLGALLGRVLWGYFNGG